MSSELRVPGNLLLCGEYAITEPGGLGLACAVDRYAIARVGDSDSLVITGRVDGLDRVWNFGHRDALPSGDLVSRTIAFVGRYFATKVPGHDASRLFLPSIRIDLDTSELQSTDTQTGRPRKLGLGSSAAVTVALTRVLTQAAEAAGLESDSFADHGPGSAAHLALSAHRYAQGGAGSGYDVLTSYYGSTGLFAGGASPRWTRAGLPLSERMILSPGPYSVSSTDAVAAYREWKTSYPEDSRAFLQTSNELIRRLASVSTRSQFISQLQEYRTLLIDLGRRIGYSAEPPADMADDEAFVFKALGAGNELVLCLPSDVDTNAQYTRAGSITLKRLGVDEAPREDA